MLHHRVFMCVAVVVCVAFAYGCGASSSAGKGSAEPANGSDTGDETGDETGGGEIGDGGGVSGDTAGGGTQVAEAGGSGEGDGNPAGDGAQAGAKPADTKPAATAKKDPFKTVDDPTKMSAFLEKPAKEALAKQQWARAVTLYSALVVARGNASPEALELAKAWTLAGQTDDAIEVLNLFIGASEDPVAIRAARVERDRLATLTNPFQTQFKPHRASKLSLTAFKAGRKAQKKKEYADAVLYYLIGSALDPDLPGFLRELGYTYDKIGAKKEKVEFFKRYLLARPFGKNAAAVRKSMAKEKGVLGKLTVDSPLPCDEVWINRQFVGSSKKLPIKNLLAAPGSYLGLCVNAKYSIAIWEKVAVYAGKTSKLSFRWAVVVNGLTDPAGRISIENHRTGKLYPLRLSLSEVGVAVPPDGRALRVKLQAINNSKAKEKYVKLQPGAREVIKW